MNKIILLFLLFISNNIFSQQLTNDIIDNFSTTSFYVISSFKDKNLKIATAFIVEVNKKLYLITNNHVVGGEFFSNEYKQIHGMSPPKDSFPDGLSLRLYNKVFGKSSFLKVSLYDKNNKELFIKFWENESSKTNLLDVVALPLLELNLAMIGATNVLTPSLLRSNLILYPSAELFVVGFPIGFAYDANLYPIWKRGTIASDPNLTRVGISKFLIDATTRQGMSGSPVFFRGTQFLTYDSTEKAVALTTNGTETTYLIGIYSAQNESLELGVVTKLDKVFEKLSKMP